MMLALQFLIPPLLNAMLMCMIEIPILLYMLIGQLSKRYYILLRNVGT